VEEMPFQLLLAVLLFGFTIVTGYTVWDHAKERAEEISCYKAVNTFMIKAQIVLNSAPGARETAEFALEGDSKLRLYNQRINGSLFGIIMVELPSGTQYLEVLPVPFEEERVFLAGEYSISLLHEREEGEDYLAVEEYAG
jgi:hypothetical protein